MVGMQLRSACFSGITHFWDRAHMHILVGVVVSAGLHVLTCTYFMAVVAMSVSARSPAPEDGTVCMQAHHIGSSKSQQ